MFWPNTKLKFRQKKVIQKELNLNQKQKMKKEQEVIKLLENLVRQKKPAKKQYPKGNSKTPVVEKVKYNFGKNKKS